MKLKKRKVKKMKNVIDSEEKHRKQSSCINVIITGYRDVEDNIKRNRKLYTNIRLNKYYQIN